MTISDGLLTFVRDLEPADGVGYASSLLLLVTISQQITRQWKSGTSKGVSVWLFVGQLVASIGFTVYSALIENMLFVVTNSALAVAAVVGLGIVLYHRRRESGSAR